MLNRFRSVLFLAVLGGPLVLGQTPAAGAPATNAVPDCLHLAPPRVDLEPAPASFWGKEQTKVVMTAGVTSGCNDLWIVRLRISGIDPATAQPVVQRTIVLRAVPHEHTTAAKTIMLSTPQAQRIQQWNQTILKLKRVPVKH